MFQVYFSTIPVTERIKLFIPCDKSCFKLLWFSMNKFINPSDWLTNENSVKTNLIKPNYYFFFIFTFFNLKFFWINSRNFSSFKKGPISISIYLDLLTNQKSTFRFETKKMHFERFPFPCFLLSPDPTQVHHAASSWSKASDQSGWSIIRFIPSLWAII